MESYIKNCMVSARKDSSESLFYIGEDGVTTARLDGYAIVPIKDYVKLLPPEKAAELQALLSV